jgi:hypothetical protein
LSCSDDRELRLWIGGAETERGALGAPSGPVWTPRMSVTAARPHALIAAISTLLPTMFMTRVRL